jgi:hypothetical protein
MVLVIPLLERVLRLPLLTLALVLAATGSLRAAVEEDFETPERSWRVADADGAYEVVRHLRTFQEAHSGQGSEYLKLRAGPGTRIHVVHDVTPARVIAELVPQVWVKADRPGIQLYARVVLPRSRDKSGRLLTALLPGSSCAEAGAWRQLQVADVARELERQVWILRREHGTQVDAKEAYIDLLVLNAYCGAGSFQLWIDDLELAGFASSGSPVRLATFDRATDIGPAPPAVPAQSVPASPAPTTEGPRLDGSVLAVGGRPLFARVIEHQGESFPWLAKLGFNVVKLATAPTNSEIDEARRLGIWLITPPPPVGTTNTVESDDRVLAWMLGDGLTRSEGPATRLIAEQTRLAHAGTSRPLICGVTDDFAGYAELADIVVCQREVLGTSFRLSSYGDWLLTCAARARAGRAMWASIESEFSPRLEAQISALNGGSTPVMVAEPLQVQLLVAEAVAAGVRGLFFRSRTRLDLQDPPTRLRAATLQLINRQLALAAPWAAGGTYADELATPAADTRVRVLETQRARLLVITQHAPHQQFVAGPWRSNATSIIAHGAPVTDQVFLVGPTRLEPLRGERAGGLRVGLDATNAVSLALLTQEPLAINHLRRELAGSAQECASLRQQVAELLYSQTAEIDRQITALGHGLPSAPSWLTRAQRSNEQAARLLQSGDLENACRITDESLQSLYQLRRAHWDRAVRSLPSPSMSPLVATYASLPQHWQLTAQMAAVRWRPNALAGGDFEDLNHMQQNGWQQVRAAQPEIESAVELSFQSPREGRSSLHLQAWTQRQGAKSGPDGWPVTITSAPIPVQPHQFVRIHGWVNVPAGIRDSHDGLIIADTIGGLTLAERIHETKGWQEFVLYRRATSSQPLSVVFGLTGLGEVWLDDLSVAVQE